MTFWLLPVQLKGEFAASEVWQISEIDSMKLLHVVKQKFDTGPPDLDKFVQIQQKTKYGFFTKTVFFSWTKTILTGPTMVWVFEALGIYIYVYLVYDI